MSYHCYIGGEYIETTGGDSKVFSRENIEYNSGGIITCTSGVGHSFSEPKGAPPMEINNMYVKVRLKESYNGEFGFDWIDVSPDDKLEIQKIQDVDFSNVEYFYKESTTDLGNIIEKSADERGAKNAVVSHYEFSNICKFVDLPYVLIKPQQEITLSAEIILREGEIKDDEIKITGDDYYDFEIVGGTKEGKTSTIKVAKAGKIDFKIKCLQEAPEKKYEFFHKNPTSPPLDVGGVVMMENKALKLKFRVIALVSSDGVPQDKAKALFKKFKEKGVKDYLNQNSLNQAGYEVEIENYNEMDNADVDDYFYAFDKADWTTKKYYTEDLNKKKKKWEYIKNPDGTYVMESDGVTYKKELKDYYEITDTITEDLQIDVKTIEEYNIKLKTKNKSYDGGVIILSEYESPSGTSAFSRTNPLNHYLLFMYSNSIEDKEVYAHEMGHMLGLPHSFYTDKEKAAYKNARENILGNGKPKKIIKDGKQIDNPEYDGGINGKIKEALDKKYDYSNLSNFYSDKNILLKYLNNFINYYKKDLSIKNYSEKFKLEAKKMISENEIAVRKIKDNNDCSYKNYNLVCHFLVSDNYKHLTRYKKYLDEILEQINDSILFYKQNTTQNFLDYYNSRQRFNYNQIKIMRDDSKNYLEVLCKCNIEKKIKK